MTKKKEREMLTARYRANIAALEEREEDLMRQKQEIENFIATILVLYTWKVLKDGRTKSFPQDEIEKETKEKMENLQSVLEELQQALELLSEEKEVLKKRVDELETSVTDQPDEYHMNKTIDNSILTPENFLKLFPKQGQKIKNLKNDGVQDQRMKHHKLKLGLLQTEETDLKNVCHVFRCQNLTSCDVLLKQVSELNEKLKNSSQKLRESEDCVKQLEEQCSKLEKALQVKIQLLEKRTDTFMAEVVYKKQENDLQNELEMKRDLMTMQEALSEVRSMKESLSKFKTPSKDDHNEPLLKLTEAADTSFVTTTSEEAEVIHVNLESKHPLPVTSTEKLSTPFDVSVSKQAISEQPIAQMPVSDSKVVSEMVNNSAVDKMNQQYFPSDSTQSVDDPAEVIVAKKDIIEQAESQLPASVVSETSASFVQANVKGTPAPLETPAQDNAENETKVLEVTSGNTKVGKNKEVEMLIARYKSNISGLEERKEYFLRQIEILENLIPTVLVWYMSKVFQKLEIPFSRERPFPERELKEEAREKLENLRSTLEELKQAIVLITEEEKIVKERIINLELLLTNQTNQYNDKMTDIDIQKPVKLDISGVKGGKGTTDTEIGRLKDQRMKFKELLEAKHTDWTKVSVELQEKGSKLSNKVKGSSQKLRESKDYVKHLEDKYFKLEKDMSAKIQLSEKRSNMPSEVSQVVGKKEERNLQEKLDNKEALAAKQEMLAEVRPMKDSISKSKTLSKVSGLPVDKLSVISLVALTLQSKLIMKDHLIKSMADELRELTYKSVWTGDKTFEAAVTTDPIRTYDWDRNTLLHYLKGEALSTTSITSNKDYSGPNPLNVKIVRKLSNESLLVEWGSPPSPEVVGFQVFLNGQFMYWVHCAKQNLVLLHPLNLKKLQEIDVSPTDVRGDVIYRSSIIYKPE